MRIRWPPPSVLSSPDRGRRRGRPGGLSAPSAHRLRRHVRRPHRADDVTGAARRRTEGRHDPPPGRRSRNDTVRPGQTEIMMWTWPTVRRGVVVDGPRAADDVWDRYVRPRRWPEWAPQI